jgi:PilZ domain
MLAQRKSNKTGIERRRHKRVTLLQSATLLGGDRVIDCLIRDVSVSGARLDILQPPAPTEALVLDLADAGRLSGRIVWSRETQAGFQFLDEPATIKSCINTAWGRHATFE